jgi:hypothetical protein
MNDDAEVHASSSKQSVSRGDISTAAHNGISAGDFTDWKRENSSFQDINAFTGGSFNIASKDQPENIDGQVTAGFYKMFGRPLFLGATSCPKRASRAGITSSSLLADSGRILAATAKSSANPCASTANRTPWSESYPLV